MGDVISAISTMIWVFVIAVIVITMSKKMKRIPSKTSGDRSYAPVNSFYTGLNKGGKPPGAVGRNMPQQVKAKDDGVILKDDKNNDWLAQQLREEAKAKVRMSDMFQLRYEHMNKCDAEFIKRFHESNCDAEGIDTGDKKRG